MFASVQTPDRFIDPDIKRLLDASLDEELRAAVQAWLQRRAMTPSGFGRRVAGDPCFVSKCLQPGRTVTLDKADRVLRFIGLLEFRPLNGPEGTDGPSASAAPCGCPRPRRVKKPRR